MKILITGGTNGIGKAIAFLLSKKSRNEIIILCRNKEKGEKTIQEIKKETENKNISMILCDYSKLSDVKNAIQEIQKIGPIDILFNNIGVGYIRERKETVDSFETTFQVNYLSHFYLTLGLIDMLEKSQTPRIITIAGSFHNYPLDLDDLQSKKKYNANKVGVMTNLCKMMFSYKLNSYLREKKSKINVMCCHPGAVTTGIQDTLPSNYKILVFLSKPFFISAEKSARKLENFFEESQEESAKRNGKFFNLRKEMKTNKLSHNEMLQKSLWNKSIELINDESLNQFKQE